MVATDFWLAQEARFKEHEHRDDGLWASHTQSRLSGSQWRLGGGFDRSLRTRFIEEAAAAGRRVSTGSDPLANWLDFLREQKLGFEIDTVIYEVQNDGAEVPMTLGHIRKLWTYSAIASRRLQTNGVPANEAGVEATESAESPAEPAPRRTFVDDEHRRHVKLLDSVIDKIGLESFLTEYPTLKKTPVMDYKAGKIKGRVSPEKRAAIEAAISASAKAHLPNSD